MEAQSYVSRLSDELRARGISVSQLHRRLAAAGHRVSRTALDKVVSDEPTTAAYLPVLLPVLDLLGLDAGDVYKPMTPAEAARHRAVRASTRHLLRAGRKLPSPSTSFSSDVESQMDDAIEAAAALLRPRRPDLFDARGRPRRRAIARAIAEQATDQRFLDEAAYTELTDRVRRPNASGA